MQLHFFLGEKLVFLQERLLQVLKKVVVVAHKRIGLYVLMLVTTDVFDVDIFFFKLHMKQLAMLTFLDG